MVLLAARNASGRLFVNGRKYSATEDGTGGRVELPPETEDGGRETGTGSGDAAAAAAATG